MKLRVILLLFLSPFYLPAFLAAIRIMCVPLSFTRTIKVTSNKAPAPLDRSPPSEILPPLFMCRARAGIRFGARPIFCLLVRPNRNRYNLSFLLERSEYILSNVSGIDSFSFLFTAQVAALHVGLDSSVGLI